MPHRFVVFSCGGLSENLAKSTWPSSVFLKVLAGLMSLRSKRILQSRQAWSSVGGR